MNKAALGWSLTIDYIDFLKLVFAIGGNLEIDVILATFDKGFNGERVDLLAN